MTDWLIEAARRPVDCRAGHDWDKHSFICRRCGKAAEEVYESGGIIGKGARIAGWDIAGQASLGAFVFQCRVCEAWTTWEGDPEDFDPDNPANVCGGSPRCCP